MASNKSNGADSTNPSQNNIKPVSFILYDHNNPNPEKRSVACKECRRTHTKCSPYYADRPRPCARCYLSKIPCEEPEESTRKRRHKDITTQTSSQQSSSSPKISSSNPTQVSEDTEKTSNFKRFKLENLLADSSSQTNIPVVSSKAPPPAVPMHADANTAIIPESTPRMPLLPTIKDLFHPTLPSLVGNATLSAHPQIPPPSFLLSANNQPSKSSKAKTAETKTSMHLPNHK